MNTDSSKQNDSKTKTEKSKGEMKAPKKKISVFKLAWKTALVLLVVLPTIWYFINFRSPPADGEPLVEVAEATTWITSPLDENGDVDYREYLNQTHSKGVTPENNFTTLFMQAVGRAPVGFDAPIPSEFFDRLGIDPPPAEGDYLQDWLSFIQAEEGESDLHTTKWDYAMSYPWDPKQFPDLDRWLRKNEHALDLIKQASMRPRCYIPRVASKEGAGMIYEDGISPLIQTFREIARTLQLRSNRSLKAGDIDACLDDLLTIRRLAIHCAESKDPVSFLVSIAIGGVGLFAETQLFISGKATVEQLAQYQEKISQLPKLKGVTGALDYERVLMLDALQHLGRNKITVTGVCSNLMFSDGEHSYLDRLQNTVDWEIAMETINRWHDKQLKHIQQATYSERIEEYGVFVDEFQQARLKAVKPTALAGVLVGGRGVKGVLVGDSFFSLMCGVQQTMLTAEARGIAEQRLNLLHLLLAIHHAKHGEYPDKLDELAPMLSAEEAKTCFTDPLNEQPLIYVKEGDSIRLYSVGRNLIDDGGTDDYEDSVYLPVVPKTWEEFLKDPYS